MQWTPAAFAQFIPSQREVQAWLAKDESFVATSDGGAFLRHVRGPGLESLYRAHALPVHAWTADGSSRYEFGAVAERALTLRYRPCPRRPGFCQTGRADLLLFAPPGALASRVLASRCSDYCRPSAARAAMNQPVPKGTDMKRTHECVRSAQVANDYIACRRHAALNLERRAAAAAAETSTARAASPAGAPGAGPPLLSSTVKARQTVSGCGVFTAFEDGRCRVRFNDRTLVSLDRWHRAAEVLHRDGKRVTVSVRCAPPARA